MTRGGVSKRPFGWLDEIVGWRRGKSSPRAIEVIEAMRRRPDVVIRDEDVKVVEAAGEAFSASLAAIGRQISPEAVTALRGALAGMSWDDPASADPIADERWMIEQMRRAYEVPTVTIPIENSRGQWTGAVVEVPVSELRVWRSQTERYGKFRAGLVAEIERRCWASTRPR